MILKRVLDVALSVLAAILLAPLAVALAIAVKLDSPGPIFFRQERVGLNGTTFQIRKFRTLRVGAIGPAVCPAGDPRITRVGAFLRRSKLDELPQLIDVIVGTMSLVGPRPEIPRYVDLWPETARREILSVRPGITDPMTLELRNEARELADEADPEDYYVHTLLPRKCAGYLHYVRSRSTLGDVQILVRTVTEVIGEPGRRR